MATHEVFLLNIMGFHQSSICCKYIRNKHVEGWEISGVLNVTSSTVMLIKENVN